MSDRTQQKGELMRELNKRHCTVAERFEAHRIFDRDGLWAALIYVRRLPVRVK